MQSKYSGSSSQLTPYNEMQNTIFPLRKTICPLPTKICENTFDSRKGVGWRVTIYTDDAFILFQHCLDNKFKYLIQLSPEVSYPHRLPFP